MLFLTTAVLTRDGSTRDHHGRFIEATAPTGRRVRRHMPDRGTSLLIYWEDLQALMMYCHNEQVHGNLLDRSR